VITVALYEPSGRIIMTVLVTAEVAGQTQQGHDGMLGALAGSIRAAPGFVLHTAHPVEGGWRVIEVWEKKDAANQFFATHVAPNLPSGIRPKRTVQELHSLVKA
jgi:quinol monooxygenase YgiN